MQNTATQKYSGSVASYDTRTGNEVGLFYDTPEPTQSSEITRLCLLYTALKHGHLVIILRGRNSVVNSLING